MQNLMTTLAQYKNTITGLAKSLNLGPADISKLWYRVLLELKSNNISSLSIETDSILDTIEKLSNLDSISETSDTGEISKLYKKIEEAAQSASSTDDYWNESVQRAIKYFNENLIKNDNSSIDTSGYNLADLKNADAGYTFNGEPYVNPKKNIRNEEYIDVRSSDSVESVLQNNTYLQFTREQNPNKWIRLIMPMNSHHVEVEDLDRNFWVIAAIIGAISSYLWDNDGELPNILKKLFDEITQLWENIAYLWLDLAMSTQNKSGDIHIEVVPLPNNSLNNYRKFDNFDVNGIPSVNDVQSRIDYLKDLYSEQDLLIIPLIRSNNYQKNWYNKEYYPYIFFFSRATNNWYSRTLIGESNSSLCFTIGSSEEADMGFTISERLGAARENEMDYSYCSPFTKIGDYEDDGNRFYGLLRIIPEISAEPYGNGIKINNLNFNLYDAARGIYQSANSFLGTVGLSSPIIIDTTEATPNPIHMHRRATDVINWNPAPNVPVTTVRTDNNKYYMGELVSWYGKTQEPAFKDTDFVMVKIGDMLPSTYANDPSNFTYITRETGGKYDTETYGVGAMVNTTPIASNPDFKLIFANYCWYDQVKYPGVAENNVGDGNWHCGEGYNVTAGILTQMSKQRVVNLVKIDQLPNKDLLCATKIGLSYWTGNDGVQWSSGMVCNLIYYNASEGKAHDIGFVGMLDGYWTDSQTVFTLYDGNKWRRLSLHADKVSIKTVGDSKTFTITGGKLIWYDHNKEVYYHNYEPMSDRPHADMTLVQDSVGYHLEFSNPVNIISGELQMFPYIDRPEGHIFKSSINQLYVNQQSGVQSYHDLASNANLVTYQGDRSYIDTLDE